MRCIKDVSACYTEPPFIPSPYDGSSRCIDYYTTEYTEYNALSDFDGIGNTDVLCSLATAQSDWRTASTITNNGDKGYSPSACCCWRYHTIGTNQGDWYLPAMGELGYLIVRLKTINTSINNIGGTSIVQMINIDCSTSYNHYANWFIQWNHSELMKVDFNNRQYNRSAVRSFIRF